MTASIRIAHFIRVALFVLGVFLLPETILASSVVYPAAQGAPGDIAAFAITKVQLAAKVPRTHGAVTRTVVPYASDEKPGTIIISNADRTLHVVQAGGTALRYSISVGRDGFLWTGTTYIGRKAEWPGWRPPAAMRQRDASLPEYVPPGPYNPLGARALYLFDGARDTLFRIHGTNSAETVGGYETSGCFRLSNADVLELYDNIKMGTKVIVY